MIYNWTMVFHQSMKISKLNYSLMKKYASAAGNSCFSISMQYFSPDQYQKLENFVLLISIQYYSFSILKL